MNVYDFDGTIFDGDASRKFCFFSMAMRPYIIIFWVIQGIAWGFHYLHILNLEKTKRLSLLYFYVVDVNKLTDKFWKRYQNRIKPWYAQCQRDDDLVITASPRFLIEPICRKLGIKNLIATEVDARSGRLLSRNCRGEEKIRRYREVYGNKPIEKFYFDSHHDVPLAMIAEKAYVIVGNDVKEWKPSE